MVAREDFATKADLKEFKDEIIHEFHVAFGRVEDKLKFFAKLQSKTIEAVVASQNKQCGLFKTGLIKP